MNYKSKRIEEPITYQDQWKNWERQKVSKNNQGTSINFGTYEHFDIQQKRENSAQKHISEEHTWRGRQIKLAYQLSDRMHAITQMLQKLWRMQVINYSIQGERVWAIMHSYVCAYCTLI